MKLLIMVAILLTSCAQIETAGVVVLAGNLPNLNGDDGARGVQGVPGIDTTCWVIKSHKCIHVQYICTDDKLADILNRNHGKDCQRRKHDVKNRE